MSLASQFHVRALARGQKRSGDTFVCAGHEFLGTRGKLKADDPRLPGAGDRAITLTVVASILPAEAAGNGATLTCGAEHFRTTREPDVLADGSALLFLVPTAS